MYKLLMFAGRTIYSLVRVIIVGSLPSRTPDLTDRLQAIDLKLETIRRKMYYDHPGTHDYSKPPGEDQVQVQPATPDPFAQAFPNQTNGMPRTGDPVI